MKIRYFTSFYADQQLVVAFEEKLRHEDTSKSQWFRDAIEKWVRSK